ncbi:VgrG-related protein [Agromyces salentinus]|uniref:VgrG-related protein n=1 Tax=Agromyces salentinus TaxID=269421 RepID=A0ABP4Z9F2_9MICO|nr:VgrG-related protein [Agromyces salentinus]
MPSVDTYTSLLLVAVEGRPMPATAASLLLTGRVTDAANLPDSFELEFTDPGGTVLRDAGFDIGKRVVLSVSENGPQGPQRLLDGEVTAIDREDVAGALRTRVRGFDRSHRLFRGRRVAAYQDKTIADIVREVADKAGVPVKSIAVAGSVVKHVTQDNVSDWVFLKRLADAAGCTFSVVEQGLVFALPTQASEAPSGAESARDDPVVIEHGVNALWLSATVTAASQVPGVEVRGWDPVGKEAVVARAEPKTRVVQLPTIKPEAVAGAFASPTYVAATGDGQQRSQESQAKAVADRIAGGFAEVEARILGNSHMRSGTAVTLKGYGAPFDGRYTVTEVLHEFASEAGYTTTVVVSNASDRSLYGLASGGGAGGSGPSADEAARMTGVVSALVSDIDDPERRGRVKLTFPYLSGDYVSSWARTVQPGAGPKRGAVVLPEVGDEVLVAFEGGRFDRPYVIGGLYNGKDEPEIGWDQAVQSGSVVRRAFTSRSGMEVVFTEESGTETLTLSTNGKAQRVTLTQSGEKGIEIISEGPVMVTAKSDATVKADQGTLSLSGSSVKIKATGEVSVEGASLKLKGTGATEVEGGTLALKGQGTAELSASGITTVKGSLVKIN